VDEISVFRIRQIHDDVLPADCEAIAQTQRLLRERFSGVREEDIEQLAEKLRNPFKQRFRTILYVAENSRATVVGFALLMHEPELRFAFLDFIASSRSKHGRGIGGALYERVRDEARAMDVEGLFFECLPDDPQDCPSPEVHRANVARMRFYEQYGARPVIHNAYRTPVRPGDTQLPYLMYDDLGSGRPPRRDFVQAAVRAILERKYAYLCPPEYIQRVVDSFVDDPVALRPPRYREKVLPERRLVVPPHLRVAMVVNDQHDIHHIRERGYVESPVRISAIRRELEPSGLTEPIAPREYPDEHITAVHAVELLEYLRRACAQVPPGKSVYPYVFPIRNAARPPRDWSVLAGYFCIDTFTPINQNAFPAAKRAVDCTLTAADEILAGRRLAYALVRPPGHHAEHRSFGGFCYFNNAAVAAQYLSRHGKVALLDIDYHHGNGQQDIFYQRSDVFTVSLHGDPEFAYPYFAGFADERGQGPGEGCNLNLPLPEQLDGPQYRQALQSALQAIADFQPAFLVVCLGLDGAKGDPTGTWSLTGMDFELNGRMLGQLGLPTLVVQEGGYRTRTLGSNARRFFQGLVQGASGR
jgi:acetoin utilization deacetylase AcuC-like enzyme/GNAT superfamily N-acetyltransferase